jgi:hypothetical protein
MILRRIAGALRRQDWFTVLVEADGVEIIRILKHQDLSKAF